MCQIASELDLCMLLSSGKPNNRLQLQVMLFKTTGHAITQQSRREAPHLETSPSHLVTLSMTIVGACHTATEVLHYSLASGQHFQRILQHVCFTYKSQTSTSLTVTTTVKQLLHAV